MSVQHRPIDEEMKDLREEIEAFRKEKERVRAIVGSVGGMPTFHTKLFNIIFIVFVVVCLVISLIHAIHNHDLQTILAELAIAAVSVKLIYLMHSQARVNHFQLWILSTMEWQLTQTTRELADFKKLVDENKSGKNHEQESNSTKNLP